MCLFQAAEPADGAYQYTASRRNCSAGKYSRRPRFGQCSQVHASAAPTDLPIGKSFAGPNSQWNAKPGRRSRSHHRSARTHERASLHSRGCRRQCFARFSGSTSQTNRGYVNFFFPADVDVHSPASKGILLHNFGYRKSMAMPATNDSHRVGFLTAGCGKTLRQTMKAVSSTGMAMAIGAFDPKRMPNNVPATPPKAAKKMLLRSAAGIATVEELHSPAGTHAGHNQNTISKMLCNE